MWKNKIIIALYTTIFFAPHLMASTPAEEAINLAKQAQDAERLAQEAEKQAQDAQKKVEEAEQKVREANQKLTEGEHKVAELQAQQAEQEAKDAEQKSKKAAQDLKEAEQRVKAIAEMKSGVENSSAQKVFQTIEGAKVTAFSKDNFIKSGWGKDDQDLKSWNLRIPAVLDFVESQASQSKTDKLYGSYTNSLKTIDRFIQESVSLLHTAYASSWDNLGNIVYDQAKIDTLKQIKEQAGKYLQVDREINNSALAHIALSTPPPLSWTKQLYDSSNKIKDAADFLKNYRQLLDSYARIGQTDFNLFMQKNGIINSREAEKMLNALDQVQFILQEKIKTDKNPRERLEKIKLVKEIITKIQERFPDYISVLKSHQLTATNDKSSIIIFAVSGSFEGALNKLIREITILLKALSAKKSPIK